MNAHTIAWIILGFGALVMIFGSGFMISQSVSLPAVLYGFGTAVTLFGASQIASLKSGQNLQARLDKIEKMIGETKKC
ncbi:MAG: hypothetical protein WCE46_07960 [Methanoregula sp.]|jgi:hypothetical protein|uniref:hypothetical protein n=1 Tax=Methanoregula sp. TaxID=2052170 RepID=UPI003C74612D